MSAKRTVDPDGEIASTRFMGLRVTTKQWYHIELHAALPNTTRSINELDPNLLAP